MDAKTGTDAAGSVPEIGPFGEKAVCHSRVMAPTSENVAKSGGTVIRPVYVPAPVAMVVGWPDHSGLSNRPGVLGRSKVFEELLVGGLAIARAWRSA